MGENIYSSYVKNEQPIKRLEQNQIYGSYRYEVVEAWNELAINMPKNVLFDYEFDISNYDFMHKYRQSNELNFGDFQHGLHKVLVDYELDFSHSDSDFFKKFSSVWYKCYTKDNLEIDHRDFLHKQLGNFEIKSFV